jgi:hypothetical protein
MPPAPPNAAPDVPRCAERSLERGSPQPTASGSPTTRRKEQKRGGVMKNASRTYFSLGKGQFGFTFPRQRGRDDPGFERYFTMLVFRLRNASLRITDRTSAGKLCTGACAAFHDKNVIQS